MPQYCPSAEVFLAQPTEVRAFLLNNAILLSCLSKYYNFSDKEAPAYFYQLSFHQQKFVITTRLHILEKIISFVPSEGAATQDFTSYGQFLQDYRGQKKAMALLLSKSESVRNDFVKFIVEFRETQANVNFFSPMVKIDYEKMTNVLKNIERQNIALPMLSELQQQYHMSVKFQSSKEERERFSELIEKTKKRTPQYLYTDPAKFLIEDIENVTGLFSPIKGKLKSSLQALLKEIKVAEKNKVGVSTRNVFKYFKSEEEAIMQSCGCF